MKVLRTIRRVLALAVGIWALALTVYFLFFARISFESTTATGVPGQSPVTTTTSGQLSWLSQAQPISIVFMLAFSLLLMAAAAALWRSFMAISVPLTLLALVFTFISGFSIGGLYFPGAVAALLGVLLLVAEKIANRPERPAT
jgi:cation transport ATPase